MSTRRNALAGLVVAGAVTVAGIAPAGASPPGPGGNGIPSICVPVPGASVTLAAPNADVQPLGTSELKPNVDESHVLPSLLRTLIV